MSRCYFYILLFTPFLTSTDEVDRSMTHQIENLIVIAKDTLYAKRYFYSDSSIYNFIEENKINNLDPEIDCDLTSCYRKYIVVWQLVGRDLYLKDVLNCCTLEPIKMKDIFGDKYIQDKGIPAKFINGCFPISDTSTAEYLITMKSNDINIYFERGKLKRRQIGKLEDYLEIVRASN